MAAHYGLTLADISSLRQWELNHLVEEMDKEARASKRPAGSVPVMT